MILKHVLAFATTMAILTTPAVSQMSEYPGASPRAVAPRAADQTLGMALLSADIHPSCTLVGGTGVVQTTGNGAGVCDVIFERIVDDCTYVAGIGWHGPIVSSPGFIGVNSLNETTLRIRTWNTSRTITDYPFHLIVFCAK